MPSLEKSNAYSSLSQLTSRIYPDGSRATFSYDEVGNRTLMADSTGRYTSMYDAVGQTMVKASPNNQRHSYSYDPIGTRRLLDASGAGRFTYAYDLTGQVTSLRNPYGERTTFSYDDSGRRTVQRNANGTRVSTVYDAVSQTTQVIHRTSGGTSLLQLDYRYDNAGNRNVLIEGGGTARTTWSYDNQNQLTSEFRTGTNAYRQTFTFDPAGNRTLKNIDGTRTTYAYDSANQLQYGQAAAGRTTYQYDLTGNQQIEQPPTGNRTTTTWNYENQPVQYLLPVGAPVTMAYNGDKRRVLKQQGSDTTKFVWDSVIDAYVKELDGSNVLIATYTNEPQHYGAVVSQRRGSTSHVLHADALGTTRLLTTSAGASSDTYLFDAWGNLIASSGTAVNPFRWVGRYGYYMDTGTGLVYVRARMYLPTMARWASVDPLDFVDGLNLYQYCRNAGILFIDEPGTYFLPTDPYGECKTCCCNPLNLQFSDIRVFDAVGVYKDQGLPVGDGEYAALGFRVLVQMENKFLFFGKDEPCEIIWYECGEEAGSLGQQPNKWFKITAGGKPPSGANTDWDDPTPCEGMFSRFWGDNPTIPNTTGASKRLNFAVSVKGGEHCGAIQKKLLFHLDVSVKKRSIFVDKTTFDPSPPVLKPGLMNIEGCGEENIANAIEYKE